NGVVACLLASMFGCMLTNRPICPSNGHSQHRTSMPIIAGSSSMILSFGYPFVVLMEWCFAKQKKVCSQAIHKVASIVKKFWPFTSDQGSKLTVIINKKCFYVCNRTYLHLPFLLSRSLIMTKFGGCGQKVA